VKRTVHRITPTTIFLLKLGIQTRVERLDDRDHIGKTRDRIIGTPTKYGRETKYHGRVSRETSGKSAALRLLDVGAESVELCRVPFLQNCLKCSE
jgi:hypothetical protein